jgi:ATP-binding cassette subfamily F protein 3
LLFVSHDRYFIDKLATRLWVVEDGTVVQRLGNYTDYLRSKASIAAPPAKPEPVHEAPKPTPAKHTGASRSESAVRKAVTGAEREISKLESKLNEISDALTIAEVDQNFEMMAELSEQFDTTQERLELAYENWETASAELQELVGQAAIS